MMHQHLRLFALVLLDLAAAFSQAQTVPAARLRPGGARPMSAGLGRIAGTLIYPSEYVPADMRVVAEPVGGGRSYASNQKKLNPKNYTYNYAMSLPAGRYYVYALTRENPGYRAYYNEFVTCGLNVNCHSHAKLVVVVATGATTPNVNPHDWYDTPAAR